MEWAKQGLIFEPSKDVAWMKSHAALPVVLDIGAGATRRVYFSGRDADGRAQIGYFEVNMNQPIEILRVSEKPVIGLGSLGSFDDSGVTSSCIVSHDYILYQYYTGWTRGVTVPFYFYIGLAVSDDGGEHFRRISAAPILERSEVDPYLTASPAILVESNIWRMWYVSCTKWIVENGALKHYYHIKYAESRDGIKWKRDGLVCIDFKSLDEYAIARPYVRKEDGIYKMWYSSRGDSYRIGYAESQDGLTWARKDDEVGIDVSSSGWDSEMVAYPFVFDHEGRKYMLYNGNGYGATGIGLAVLARS